MHLSGFTVAAHRIRWTDLLVSKEREKRENNFGRNNCSEGQKEKQKSKIISAQEQIVNDAS